MYLLDLMTVTRVLHAHAYTCLLHAELPEGIDTSTEPCTVSIAIVKGTFVSCAILTRDGFFSAINDEAYSLLAHTGCLNWTLTLQLSSSLLPPLSSQTTDRGRNAIPRRLVEPQSAQLRTLTRTQRLVFSLINGKNSVTYIAYLLALSSTCVEQTVRELYQMNLITLDSPRPLPMSSRTQHLGKQGDRKGLPYIYA